MSRLKQLITVIHRRSVWQVLLVYIGVSWGVLEATSLVVLVYAPTGGRRLRLS